MDTARIPYGGVRCGSDRLRFRYHPRMRTDAAQTGTSTTTDDAMFAQARALVQQGEHEQAFARYVQAAETGHAPSAIEAARMALHGVGTAQDVPRARAWLAAAEQAGHPAAAYHLAWLGAGATALPFDGAMQARLLTAANGGHPSAMLALAVYFGHKAAPEDQQRCVALLEQAAQAGHAIAAGLLAERLARGEGTAPDPVAAAQLRAQLVAAGHPSLPDVPGAAGIAWPGAPGVLELADVLSVPAATQRAEAPRVWTIDGLLSADECRLLIAHSLPQLKRSRAVDPRTGAPREVELRTSSDATHDPMLEDVAIRLVQARMAAAAGVPLAHAERLTVLRYLPGEQYRPHRDYLPPGSPEIDRPKAGNRLRTICVYLNTAAAGGATAFPRAGLEIAPKAGRAVVFDNLHGDGRPDPDSLHAGLPVEAGEKWLATLWIRQRPYRSL